MGGAQGLCERWFRDNREQTFTAAFNAYKDSGDFERAFEEHFKRLVEERLTQNGVRADAAPRRERWRQGSPANVCRVLHKSAWHH
jgi:hypothetical protein